MGKINDEDWNNISSCGECENGRLEVVSITTEDDPFTGYKLVKSKIRCKNCGWELETTLDPAQLLDGPDGTGEFGMGGDWWKQ